MISFKLKRDDARWIEEHWLRFMIRVAETKMNDAKNHHAEYLNCKLLHSQLQELQVMFQKKLLTSPVKLKFKLSDAHAITFYKFLMAQPISEEEVYYINMRQQLCDGLHHELFGTVETETMHESYH